MNKKATFLISVGLVLTFGLTTIWSTVPNLLWTQVTFLVFGLILAFLVYKIDPAIYLGFSPVIYLFCVGVLLITLVFGHSSRGATRWIGFGSFAPQPSELVKPLLAIFYADFLSRNDLNKYRNLIIYGILALVPVILVLVQPDLGSALVLAALAFFIAIFSGLKLTRFLPLVVIAMIAIPLMPKFLKPYQMDRFVSFVNPYHDPQGKGYNVIQSVIAVGSGGLIGKGVKLGTQSHLNFLPERHTDFIFASFAEEFGFLGVTILLFAYSFLLLTLQRSAHDIDDKGLRLLQFGVFSIFLFQVIVNVGMNLGVMPVTGITLPLFSYGGSSLISFMILLGISLRLLELNRGFEL